MTKEEIRLANYAEKICGLMATVDSKGIWEFSHCRKLVALVTGNRAADTWLAGYRAAQAIAELSNYSR